LTKIDERISLELEQDLKALFEEDVACEVDSHGEQPQFHEGDGEWYLTTRACRYCGDDAGVTLICDKFKTIVEETMHSSSVPCGVCKRRNRVSDIVVGFDRRGGK
jgi:hypothetical protein